jgi:ribose 5-phosphate isomerase A
MSTDANSHAAWKRAAAHAAVELVTDGMIVGIGTGSTATFAIHALADRMRAGLRVLGIPSSDRSAALATSLGIPLTTFADHPRIDLTIDGADEVERGTLNLIKGHGGALLREKIVAVASRRLAIIVDGTKLVDRLGERSAVPVEVVAFGYESTRGRLESLGATVDLRCSPDGKPLCTDSGNRILDCRFGPIAAPAKLEEQICRIVGVVECGLFVGLADVVFIGDAAGVTRWERTPRPLPPLDR